MVHDAQLPATSLGPHPCAHPASADASDRPRAAMWAFVTVAWLAMGAAGVVAGGAAAHSELSLATVPLEAMTRTQDVCTASTAGIAPTQAP